jgi:phenylpropionate dioxygenase-like ring-hydroxylating dioxygenase large terminal subunit
MHGFEFDRDGKCVSMPIEDPALAESKIVDYSIPAFKTIECDGYVWVWMGDRRSYRIFSLINRSRSSRLTGGLF